MSGIHLKAGSVRFGDGVIHLGEISSQEVHYGEDIGKPMCRYDETGIGTLSTVSTDWPKVTCKSCVEWRHA